MKSFYTTVQICVNEALNDVFTVGIIMFNEKALLYHIFEKRLRFIMKALHGEHANLPFLFEQMQINLRDFKKNSYLLDSSHYQYLKKYSEGGQIRFTAPKRIALEVSTHDFQYLVNMLFHEDISQEAEEASGIANHADMLKHLVADKLISKVEGQVHTNIVLSKKNVPGISFKYKLDCLGKNGALIGAKFQDFTLGKASLERNVNRYLALIGSLGAHYGYNNNKFYLLAQEPAAINSEHHAIWEAAVDNSLLAVIHPEEAHKVAEHILQSRAHKIFA